jgi:orotate phosphoribosyltransferase-like protein
MSKTDNSFQLAQRARSEADAMQEDNERAVRAYELRASGTSWWDIAEELGISEGQAANLVAHKIAAAARLVDEGYKRTLLAMEIERLDRLQQTLWDRALGGELRAVDQILRIITTRAKILGLENAVTNNVTNNTVVVAGNSEEYIAALQRATKKEITNGD